MWSTASESIFETAIEFGSARPFPHLALPGTRAVEGRWFRRRIQDEVNQMRQFLFCSLPKLASLKFSSTKVKIKLWINSAPYYVLTEFRHAHLFHGYNTRSRDLLRPPFPKITKNQAKESFRINGAATYNTLPRIIRQVETLSEFKLKLKRHFKQ